MNNSALYRDGNRLGSVAGPKLFHDVFDVDLDRFFRDKEPFSNVAVTVAATDLLQHLNFPGSQCFVAVVFCKVGCYLLRNSLLSGMHLADGLDQLFGWHALEHVAACSRLKRSLDLDVSFRRSKHDKTSVGIFISNGNHGAVNTCPSGQTSPAPRSNTISIPFNVTASGSVSPRLLLGGQQGTSGTRNPDFALAPGSTCVGNVTAGSTCTVNVAFAPKFAGLRPAAIQLINNTGVILSTNLLYGYGLGPQVAFNQAAQTTAVGGVGNPTSVAVDASGDVYVAQENGTVTAFIGGSKRIVASGLGGANSLTVDGAGNLYIADPYNHQVLEVTPKNGQTTVGTGLVKPRGVAVDGEGNVFIADSINNRVVKVLGGTDVQSTVGTGLNFPSAVAVDGLGDVYIADTGNTRVVEVAANGEQTSLASGLPNPISVALDAAGDVYVVDASSSVVEISPNGTQSTLGSGLSEPSGVALDGAGDLFISDYTNNRVMEVQQSRPQGLSLSAPVNTVTVQSMTVQNIGNQPLDASGLSVSGANFEQVEDTSSLEDCYSTISLAGGASCNLSIMFWQSSTGSFSGSAVLTEQHVEQHVRFANDQPSRNQSISRPCWRKSQL